MYNSIAIFMKIKRKNKIRFHTISKYYIIFASTKKKIKDKFSRLNMTQKGHISHLHKQITKINDDTHFSFVIYYLKFA